MFRIRQKVGGRARCRQIEHHPMEAEAKVMHAETGPLPGRGPPDVLVGAGAPL
jgi:hypothetical protein